MHLGFILAFSGPICLNFNAQKESGSLENCGYCVDKDEGVVKISIASSLSKSKRPL